MLRCGNVLECGTCDPLDTCQENVYWLLMFKYTYLYLDYLTF